MGSSMPHSSPNKEGVATGPCEWQSGTLTPQGSG